MALKNTLGETTQKDLDNFNACFLKLLRIQTYLVNSRDDRKKGNKLAPEEIIWNLTHDLLKGK
jgi:hypothetical protein